MDERRGDRGRSPLRDFAPGPLSDAGYPHVRNPAGIDSLRSVLDAARLSILVVLAMMVASAASLVVRFRGARGAQRQQLKWLAAAAAAVASTYAVVEPLSPLLDPSAQDPPGWLVAAQTFALLSFALIPIAIVFAVLRYRLYEIDVIIRRTLVYAVLVAVLATLYLGGVTLVGGASAEHHGWVGRDRRHGLDPGGRRGVSAPPGAHPAGGRPPLLPRPLRRGPHA